MIRRGALIIAVLLALTVPAAAQSPVEVIASVRADLAQRGVSIAGPCGAFEIISRAAWEMRDAGVGLFGGKNPAQNGCTVNGERYAVDVLVSRDGCAYDALINSETENRPAWQLLGCSAAGSWRAPFARDVVDPSIPSVSSAPATLPPPPPAPLPSVDLTPLSTRMDLVVDRLGALSVQLISIDTRLAAIEAEQKALRADASNLVKKVVQWVLPAIAGLLGGRVIK
jgi:hypothetical protein